MDFVNKKTRSRFMASVKPKGNFSTELRVVKLLRKNGIKGWRRHALLPGTPDFCWSAEKVVLFIDGCFWHGCPRCYTSPKSNVRFWKNKINTNKRHDRRIGRILRKDGWKVFRIWEHRLKMDSSEVIKKIKLLLKI